VPGDASDTNGSYVTPHDMTATEPFVNTAAYNQTLTAAPAMDYRREGLAIDLGSINGPSLTDDPLTERPGTLTGDGSCAYAESALNLSCAPGSEIHYQIFVQAFDLGGRNSVVDLELDLIDIQPVRVYSKPDPYPLMQFHPGDTIQLLARLVDADGNLATDNCNLAITLEQLNGTGNFSGETTVNAYLGDAYFMDLSYDTSETVQVRFTAPGLAPSDPVTLTIYP